MATKQKLTEKDIKKAKKRFQNRNITKAKRLYWFMLFNGVFMALYAAACLAFKELPFIIIFSPILLALVYLFWGLLVKNQRVIWLYIQDMEQGRLLLFLNQHSHFEEEHKIKLVQWVYLRKKTVRNETSLRLRDKIMNGQKLDPEEKNLIQYKVVSCPQQLLDGFNKAILVNALIWAHVNVYPLDRELRDVLDLTDEHMAAFRIQDEIDKCKKK